MAKKRERPYGADITPVNPLDNLFGDSSSAAEFIPIEDIVTRSQARRFFDSEKSEQLVQSVKQHGILEPLLVRPFPNNKYELVAGERRYRAAQAVGLTEIPAVVKELSEEEAYAISLIENLQRENLNPVEETEGILQLLALNLNLRSNEIPSLLYRMKNAGERQGIDLRDNAIPNPDSESEQRVQSIFAGLGTMSWMSFTRNRLPLLKLPGEILEALGRGQIEYTKAKAIARLKKEEDRRLLLAETIEQSLSLKQIRERIKSLQATPNPTPTLKSRLDSAYRRLSKGNVWNDAKKQEKLEKLLAEMEALLEES
ncbi:MAG: ParB/RepB/Spo0J family partition protein [Xenococcaceae cyanobacterium]